VRPPIPARPSARQGASEGQPPGAGARGGQHRCTTPPPLASPPRQARLRFNPRGRPGPPVPTGTCWVKWSLSDALCKRNLARHPGNRGTDAAGVGRPRSRVIDSPDGSFGARVLDGHPRSPGHPLGRGSISAALLMTELALTRIFSSRCTTTSRSWRSRSPCSACRPAGVRLPGRRRFARYAGPRSSLACLAYSWSRPWRSRSWSAPRRTELLDREPGLDAGDLRPGRSAFFAGGASSRWPCPDVRSNQPGVRRDCWRLGGMPCAHPAARSRGRPGRGAGTASLGALAPSASRAGAGGWSPRRPWPWRCCLGRAPHRLLSFDVTQTKGHEGDRVLFSKWNSFSRVAVYDKRHGDWSLSKMYTGPTPESRFMTSTRSLDADRRVLGRDSRRRYLGAELTSIAYYLAPGNERSDETRPQPPDVRRETCRCRSKSGPNPARRRRGKAAGSAGSRPSSSAPRRTRHPLSAGVRRPRVDGVEINPIIATE